MNPPGQSSTESLHTATLLIYIERREIDPQSVEHRGLAYCYTTYIYIYIYRREMNHPGHLSTEALHTITLLIYIEREVR